MCTIFNINFHSFSPYSCKFLSAACYDNLPPCPLTKHTHTHTPCENTPLRPLRQISSIQIRVPSNCFLFKVKYTTWEKGSMAENSHVLLYHGSVNVAKSRRFRLAGMAQFQLQVLGFRPYLVGGGFSFTTPSEKI